MMLSKREAIARINHLGSSKTPFFFFTDFKGEKAYINTVDKLEANQVFFSFKKQESAKPAEKALFTKKPIPFEVYHTQFQSILHEINYGNSFLVNLTFKTEIETSLNLKDIYEQSKAKYKVRFADSFVCFSPETFVKIADGHIYSYPMKGTIDAEKPNAQQQLLNDPKEIAEHVTIVDLIRNDLSQIATDVTVAKFRFITEIATNHKKLLQVSSEIVGKLDKGYEQKLGDTIFKLLPAGSISGAPKTKTIEIIENCEESDRGFYTGICGYFDGQNLDTGVMIRFIEKDGDQLYYRSGGGITSFSDPMSEYQEMIDKIYLPH